MLTDTEDDFFFEEDKMSPTKDEILPLLINIEESLQPLHYQKTSQELEQQHEIKDSIETIDTANANQITAATLNAATAFDVNDMETTVICSSQDHMEKLSDFNRQRNELERLGMTVTTNSVVITKDESNLIGISIGGGAPMCPCLYIVQVFDGTPAARQGSLQSGDELLAINSVSVKGKTKVEVAKMIQATTTNVTIHYNKLHADPEQGKSLDIILKKIKHRIVDSMSSNTADTLGLSRAILCNDSLVKRLEELEGTEQMYKGLVEHARRMLKAYYDLLQTQKSFGDVFTQISVREPQQRASEAFRMFGEFHRNLEKDGVKIIKQIKPILDDMGTYLNKAIPDTKMTVRRYADAKFTYLSYCLKVKEMDDEEHGFAALQEPLYRVETGNYEYRLILRCRQDARSKFAKLRTDVLEKMELLEAKHATDLNKQLRGLLDNLALLNKSVVDRIEALPTLFPIEVDFKETDFQYKSSTLKPQEMDDEDEEENACALPSTSTEIVCGQEALEQPAKIVNVSKQQQQKYQNENQQQADKLLTGLEDVMEKASISTTNEADSSEVLLKELGLFGIDLSATSQAMSNSSEGATAQVDTFNFDLFLNQAIPATTQLEKDLMATNSCEMDLLLQ